MQVENGLVAGRTQETCNYGRHFRNTEDQELESKMASFNHSQQQDTPQSSYYLKITWNQTKSQKCIGILKAL